ncbi:hypothetical protein EMPS_04658 [Entomortierella parvispora]|uniref:Uncharacterized protein n=1 Tax=Entomortierella parvispora TaxID=205924 RepID=A0A9P3H909_9FUNG|nr:hypothetical protein EMPS_04658 [Entomortierella parvispora]
MLTPVPAIFDQSDDSLSLQPFHISSSSPLPSSSSTDTPQPLDPYQHSPSYTYSRATRTASQRSSKLSKTSHHHRHRPSKQFVATTSNAIFGDWDLDLKIEHRTKGRNSSVVGTEAGAVATAGAGGGSGGAGRSGGRGGVRGGGFTIGPGPGIHTGSLGTQPLSSFPSASPSIAAPTSIPGRHPTSSSIPSTQAHNTALNILKGQRSNQSFQNNKMASLPKGSGLTSTALSNNNGQQKHKNSQRNTDNNSNAVAANKTTIMTAASSSPAHKPPAAQKHLQQGRQQQQQPLEQKQQLQIQQPTLPQQQQQQNGLTGESHGTTPASGSAKSGFLRALGKFKNKHMLQKRSSAPPPAHESIDPMASAVDDNRRASYVLPPMQFGESDVPTTTTRAAATTLPDKASSPLRQHYEQQQLQAQPAPTSPTSSGDTFRRTDSMNMDTLDTPASSVQGDMTEKVSNPSSSLRVKFKNRVSNTLASMKSSSNMRDRAKADQQNAASGTAAVGAGEGESSEPSRRFLLGDRRQSAQASLPTQDQQSQEVNATTPPNTLKKRSSRNFWTFPRVRLDTTPTTVTSKQGWEESATVSPTADAYDEDVTMMSPDAGPGENVGPYSQNAFARLHHEQQGLESQQQQQQHQQQEGNRQEDRGEDSDDSIDIIQPADYQDYTQFAELPLKKRKKMERSLAASLAAETSSQNSKRPNSVRASADAMRRFLLLQQQQKDGGEHSLEAGADGSNITGNNSNSNNNKKKKNKKNKGQATEDTLEVVLSREMGPPPVPATNKANKRPQLSTSSLDSTDQIPKRPTTTATQGGGGASDWRRSFLKSLHLGRGLPKKKGGPLIVQEHQSPASSSQVVTTSVEEQGRASRSGSVRSTRSRSLVTATHPALLATTMVPTPRGTGQRRETLEMAMRRRRQSSAARSRIGDTGVPPPLPSELFAMGDNSSTMNITHTFTSFTLELADMHARDVMNNSATPGLFNWKFGPPASLLMNRRQTQTSMSRRITVSSNVMDVDTDQEFKGFDSDGDALSGYTGDADVSMEEIYVRPKTPTSSGPRPVSRADMITRRRLSSIDGDSDAISDLPSLSVRTREFNRSSGGGAIVSPGGPSSSKALRQTGSSFIESVENDARERERERERPKSPPGARRGANSPNLTRKTARMPSSANIATTPRAPLSMEEVVSWKPRNAQSSGPVTASPPRPVVPALDTSKTQKSAHRGASGGLSSSTTLVPSASARTPSTAASSGSQVLTASPTEDRFSLRQTFHQHHLSGSGTSASPLHFRHPSSSQQSSSTHQHSQDPSADTLVSHHKHFSSASNASTLASPYHHAGGSSSGGHHAIATAMAAMHAEQELQRQRQQLFLVQKQGSGSGSSSRVAEFDPSVEFPPVTPVDLKAMDFETLLATAERDHLQGWEDLKQQKKNLPSVLSRATVAPAPAPVSPPLSKSASPPNSKSSRANLQPLKIITHHSPPGLGPSNTTAERQGAQSRNAVAFDLSPSDDGTASGLGGTTGTGTGSDRSGNMRSKRVMKKKMSVIRLTGNGNIQGRRDDDGVIRVSMSSTNYSRQPQQQPPPTTSASHHSSNQSSPGGAFSPSGRYHQQQQDWRQ